MRLGFGGGGMLTGEAADNTRHTLMRMAAYLRPYRLQLLVVALFVTVSTVLRLYGPMLIGRAIDQFIATGDAAGLRTLAFGILAIYLSAGVASTVQGLIMVTLGQRFVSDIRAGLFSHMQIMSMAFHDRNQVGDLMSRITNDSDTIQQVVGFALVQVLSSVVLIIWIIWQMLVLNWAYALISLSVVPLMGLATLWVSNQARKAFRVTRQSIGDVNAELEEGISGVREVQAFSREETNIEQFRQSNAVNRDANIKAVAYTSALVPTLEALGFFGIAVVVGVGGVLLLRGQPLAGSAISLGLIITFLGYAQRFNMPISQISVMWTNIQSAIAGVERIFELLDEIPEVQEKVDAKEMHAIEGAVTLENVEAEYVSGEPVLKGINLSAQPGETVAIVGPTGAGKTTIINLLPRFWDVTGGSVRIDGVDVRDVQLHSLRQQIGIVLQDTYLFSSSVMDNIRFSRSDASDEEVISAAKLAQAHDFIERLPDGYETVLGERGSGLSQGQRQLLAIARAALADPRILILDEATSSVDTRTEQRIQAALNDLLKGRTSFVIAHRLSTIRSADQVLVLRDGEIIERGTHEGLLAQRGFYYELYMNQFRRQEDAPVQPNGSGPTRADSVRARQAT
jgi:ATP-binding cassette subfamily B multidrug efflux pump